MVQALQDQGLGLAVAESCTGGRLSAAIVDVPGASATFAGGMVAYADRAKSDLLGVGLDVLREDGAVSKACAIAMAEGASRRFGAQVGLAVTGIAGPGGGVPGKPVGTVWIAVFVRGVASAGGRVHAERHRFNGTRLQVQRQSVRAALALLAKALRQVEGPVHG